MRPHVPDLKVEKVNGGHWLQLEKADEVNNILDQFLEKKRWVYYMSAQIWEPRMQTYEIYNII